MSKFKQTEELLHFLKSTKMIKASNKASEKSLLSFQEGLRESQPTSICPHLAKKIGGIITATITIGMAGLLFLSSGLLETERQGEGGIIKKNHQESGEVPNNDAFNDDNLIEKEKELEHLSETYRNIIIQIQDYKFPTDGVVKEDRTTVYYENGYNLFKIGMGYSVTYDPEDGPAEPTKEQYLPIIVGLIHSTHNKDVQNWKDFDAINRYIDETLEQLNQAKAYSEEYPSFSVWLDETIGYLEKAKKLAPNDEAIVLFKKALTNIDQFVEVKEIAEK